MGLPRLLVIDDDVQLLRALARMVRRSFETATAASLIDARRLLTSQSFDVILCDMRMPATSGQAFVASLPAALRATVVLMSGDQQSKGALAMYPQLLKPFTLAELLRAIASRCPAAA